MGHSCSALGLGLEKGTRRFGFKVPRIAEFNVGSMSKVRARADSEVLEVDMGRDSGGRGVKIRRALTNVSNQLGFGFRIPQLVGLHARSLQSRHENWLFPSLAAKCLAPDNSRGRVPIYRDSRNEEECVL